jgi:hypothetical protein
MIDHVRLCGKCGLVPARPGQWSCTECHKAYMVNRRNEAAALRARTTRVIDPAVVLALLANGPRSRDDLAVALNAPIGVLKQALLCLSRAGKLKRTGGTQSYALMSYVAKPGRPAVPSRYRQTLRRGLCATCHRKRAQHQHRGLCRTCARAAGLYTKTSFELDRERVQRRAERAAVAAPLQFAVTPVRQTRSCVVEGVEYQIVDYDALLERDAEHWPNRGSSLAAPFFDRPRLKNEIRRGAHL